MANMTELYEFSRDLYMRQLQISSPVKEVGWGTSKRSCSSFPVGKSEDTITVLDPKTLKIETTFELEGKENANMYGSYL